MMRSLPIRAAMAAAIVLTPVSKGFAAAPLPYGGLDTHYGYAELAELASAAPFALKARITTATLLPPESAPGLAAGQQRYLVEAQVTALLAGRVDLPPVIRYLVDLPADPAKPRARLKLKGVEVLLLAQPAQRPGELRLIGPRAQIAATPENEARLRAILGALVARDAPPAITGIDKAFHVAGSLPGEGETQIFLKTADHRPISLSVLRRPGEQPRWAVALSEMVDASAEPPPRETLLWYRLACGLPRTLPPRATESLSSDDARMAAEDYGVVLNGLGACDRGR